MPAAAGRILRLLVLAAALGGAILLRLPLAGANAARGLAQFRYTPDPALARVLAGAHRSSAADALWLRALPDISRPFGDTDLKARWLDAVLQVVTGLEPSFVTVYSCGAAYYEIIKKDPEAVMQLLEKGVAANPDSLPLRVKLVMAYLEHGHRTEAMAQLDAVLNHPDCDSLTAGFCSALRVDDHQDVAALSYWAQYLDSGNADVREEALVFLERAKKRIHERARKEFEEQHGRPPHSPDELRDPRLLSPLVMDDVLGSVEYLPDGKLDYPKLVQLEARRQIRAIRTWCQIFYRDEGRWPTLQEVLSNGVVPVPRLPTRHHYELHQDELQVVPDR